MTEEIDGKRYSIKELEKIRRQQLKTIERDPENWDTMGELLCADCLLCEEHVKDLGPSWKNYELCVEIHRFGQRMVLEGQFLDLVHNVCARAGEVLFSHPRLRCKLLRLQIDAKIEKGDEDSELAAMGIDDDSAAWWQLSQNIIAADQERFEDIVNEGHLRHDPIEWTEDYEKAIHLAEEKAYAELGDFPRGMGFCHAYWPTLQRILREDYGINWRSPAEMNPRVIFD